MLENLTNCPLCSNDSFSNHLTCKDHFLTGQSFTITKCNKCSFLFTNPRPNQTSIGAYYKSDEYISHTSKSKSPIDLIYKTARHFTLSQKLKLVNRITSDKTIMDFGCGTGDFLAKCKTDAWTIHGVEPDDDARKIATKNTATDIKSKLNDQNGIDNLDLITLWHVLEHIPALNETFSQLAKLLQVKGKMLIAVPNYHSYDAQRYMQYWAAYDVPRHLYHFSQDTIKLILKNHGLKILETLPMKLDAYYVTLLSEKYKFGKVNYAKSFINGYKSNTYANNNNNNYSSLIYIAGK